MRLEGTPVTIVGAGIAGLAAACALARRGARVRVLEQAPAIAEVGAGLQISPNGLAVLDALGLGDAIRARSVTARAIRLRDHRGAPVLTLDLARYQTGRPYLFVHRARLIEVLEAGARRAGAVIETGVRLDGPPEGDGLVVGADGVRSVIRPQVDGPSEPFFTGQVAWRATIEDGGAAPEAQVFMGPGRHLVSYPLAGGLRNIVAVEERALWAEEGWHHEGDPAALRAAFAGFAPDAAGWLAQVRQVHLWGLFRHPVAARWHKDRAAILGDAAHPTLPFLAQGANMALEDAWVLADCLDRLPGPEALAAYQSLRRDRVVRVIAAAERNARNYHLSFPPLRAAAHLALRAGGRIAPDFPLRQFRWLYDHDVTAGQGQGAAS